MLAIRGGCRFAQGVVREWMRVSGVVVVVATRFLQRVRKVGRGKSLAFHDHLHSLAPAHRRCERVMQYRRLGFLCCDSPRVEVPQDASELGKLEVARPPDRPWTGISFPPQRRMAIFKTCSATRTEFLRGARFREWRMSRRKAPLSSPSGRWEPGSSGLSPANHAADPRSQPSERGPLRRPLHARRDERADTQSRALRGARFLRVWPFRSGLTRNAIDALRFSIRARLRGLAMTSPPLRRELHQRRQARACRSNTPAGN